MVRTALQQLDDDYPHEGASAIRTMAHIYDEKLFHHATFADFIGRMSSLPVKHFSANATDFSNSLPFRFQATETIGDSTGFFGNSKHVLPDKAAAKVTLGEAMACSSCFPGGFEPMVFPDDFALASTEDGKELRNKYGSFGIMDGGCVDNQGIEPIVLLRKRRDIDLFIISDAGRGQDKPFGYEESNVMDSLTVHKVNVGLNVAILALAQFLLWVPKGFWFGFFLALTIVFLSMRLATALTTRHLLNRYSQLVPFSFHWKGLLRISFSKYINLIASRAKSMYQLTNKVFLKHIRSLNYATVYGDDAWQNRRIMNALYELCTGKNWGKHLTADEEVLMAPSEAILAASDKAASMNTTLWWSEKDRAEGKPEALMATGQYNICWNLLEFIYRLRRNNENLGVGSNVIIELQEKLEADWQRFKDDPYWMLKELCKVE